MKELFSVLRNRNLALLLSGDMVSVLGDWLYLIALSVAIFRYSHHNTIFISLLWILRIIPGIVLGPFAGALADRIGYRQAMLWADLGRGILVTILAVALTTSTWAIIYPIAFLVSAFGSLFTPASTGLLPSLVTSQDELVAANAAYLEESSIAMIAGSAFGGYVAGLGFISQILYFDAATFVVSVLSLWFIRTSKSEESAPDAPETTEGPALVEVNGGHLKSLIAGFRFLASRPALVFAASVMIVPELATGAMTVWLVPYSQQYLHLGASGAGYLYGALGVGYVVGGFVAASLGSSTRLDQLLAISIVAVGAILALVGLVPLAVVALVLLATFGIAESLEMTSYSTLLQQSVPRNIIGQASGTMGSLFFNMTLIGTVVSGFLAQTLGLTTAIVALGTLTLIAAGLGWWRLYRDTAGQPAPAELARVPAFAGVSPSVREWAVRRMARESFPQGTTVVRQGEEGNTFYVIAGGTAAVQVASDGRTVTTNKLGPGDVFGEIALLRNVPRTATVRALEPLTVYALKREDFDELQERALQFKESLLEMAASRLQEGATLHPLLLTR